MTTTSIVDRAVRGTEPASRDAERGAAAGLILGGPDAADGPESLTAFLNRCGHPPAPAPDDILSSLRMSGLQGRGGGGFPLWRKIQAALDAPGDPMLVLNCSESEPASRKDWVVSSRRPQLMLEGAAYLARLLCADEVFVHLHHGATETMTSLQRAVEERAEARAGEPVWRLSSGPAGYVAGEGSAIARFLHAGVALPMFSTVPLAHRGPAGRPTVVCNAETAAQVAAIMRIGAAAWRALGSASCPGPQLLTLTGAVPRPGTVVEVTGQTSIGEILSDAGVTAPPAAVLVGGYAGTWLRGETAWGTSMEPTALARLGASRGCGLLGVLPRGTCGLAETARLTVFLAGESAGQCGPCVHGLPVLADCMIRLATGAAGRRTMRRLRRTGDGLPGSGACAHPDGVVRLVRSALDVFDADLVLHRSGRPCRPSEPALFPVPGFRAS